MTLNNHKPKCHNCHKSLDNEVRPYNKHIAQLEAENETLQRIGEDKVILNEQVHALEAENEELRELFVYFFGENYEELAKG